MRRAAFAFATAITLAVPALAGDALSVTLDQVRMLAFPKPITTLYVANPTIADVTMLDKRHGFILGKAFGSTNIIALDAAGKEVSNREIVVAGGGSDVVTLHKGTSQYTYDCASGRCELSPQQGDAKDVYDAVTEQIQKSASLGESAGKSQ